MDSSSIYQLKRQLEKKLRLSQDQLWLAAINKTYQRANMNGPSDLIKKHTDVVVQHKIGPSKYTLMLRTIISGGAFTNKLESQYKIRADVDLGALVENAKLFLEFARGLHASIEGFPFIVYRSINLKSISIPNEIIQPIPFSTSWNVNLAIEKWQLDECCLVEIYVPKDYLYVFMSHPYIDIYNVPQAYLGQLNQEQQEVILAPSRLVIFGEPTIVNGRFKLVKAVPHLISTEINPQNRTLTISNTDVNNATVKFEPLRVRRIPIPLRALGE